MKKKVNIFGKGVPVLALFVLGIALVSAALVGYLSGMVIGEVTVESPMLAGISLGEADWGGDAYPDSDHNIGEWTTEGTLVIESIHGGGIVTLYTLSENVGEVEITAHEAIIIENEGITCGDFESITSRFDSIYGTLGYGRLHTDIPGGDCYRIDENSIEIWSLTDTSTWSAGEADVAEWVITFKTDALGEYTFSYQVLPAPA